LTAGTPVASPRRGLRQWVHQSPNHSEPSGDGAIEGVGWDVEASHSQICGYGVRVTSQQLVGGVQRLFQWLFRQIHLEPLGSALHFLKIAEARKASGAKVAGNGLRDVGDVVQHVCGRGLQIVSPLLVGRGRYVAIAPPLADGRRGLGHDALRLLHHVHLPLQIAGHRLGFRGVAGLGGLAHVLGAHQYLFLLLIAILLVLPGRRVGTAASVIATGPVQLGLFGEVIADRLTGSAPNAAAGGVLRRG